MGAVIFQGDSVKTLKGNLKLGDNARFITGVSTDPTVTAVEAEPGSMLIMTDGRVFRKIDSGLTTNWVQISITEIGNYFPYGNMESTIEWAAPYKNTGGYLNGNPEQELVSRRVVNTSDVVILTSNTSVNSRRGTRFDTVGGGVITSVFLDIANTGSLLTTANLNIFIQGHDAINVEPDNVNLAQKTNIPYTSLPTVNGGLFEVVFDTPVNLAPGTPYWIVIANANTDGTNVGQLSWRRDDVTDPKTDYGGFSNDSGVTWGTFAAVYHYDIYFGELPTVLSISKNTTNPLGGVSDLAVTKAASDATDEGLTLLSETINRSDRGKDLYFEIETDLTDANYPSGDLVLYAYDVTNSQILPVIPISDLSSSGGFFNKQAKIQAKVIPNSNTAQVRLSAHIETDNAAGSSWTGYFDKASLTINNNTLILSDKYVGEITFTGSTVVPKNHLYCNGDPISRTEYPDLFAAIGTTYGAGDGSTTFNLPDMRGEFLRGWDDGRGVDLGRTLGSFQGDATSLPTTPFTTDNPGGHTHTQQGFQQNNNIFGGIGSVTTTVLGTQSNAALGTITGSFPHTGGSTTLDTQSGGGHSHNITGGGDSETRPRNVAHAFYICYRRESNLTSTFEQSLKTFTARAYMNSPQDILATNSNVGFDVAEDDLFGAIEGLDTTSFGIRSPKTQKYLINVKLQADFITAGDFFSSQIRIDGSPVAYDGDGHGTSTSKYSQMTVIKEVPKGSLVTVYAEVGSDTDWKISGNAFGQSSYIEMIALPDYTHNAAYKVDEYLEVTLNSNTVTTTAGVPVDVAGAVLPLTAGEWQIGYGAPCFFDWISGASNGITGNLRLTDSSNNTLISSSAYTISSNDDGNKAFYLTNVTNVILTEADTVKLRVTCSQNSSGVDANKSQIFVDVTSSLFGTGILWARRIK